MCQIIIFHILNFLFFFFFRKNLILIMMILALFFFLFRKILISFTGFSSKLFFALVDKIYLLLVYIYIYIYIYLYKYIYIYVYYTYIHIYGIHIELRFFDSVQKVFPSGISNPRPRAYRAHALTTGLSGRTMRCA